MERIILENWVNSNKDDFKSLVSTVRENLYVYNERWVKFERIIFTSSPELLSNTFNADKLIEKLDHFYLDSLKDLNSECCFIYGNMLGIHFDRLLER